MEKRKLLLVAVSVGVFLVIVLSAAILIFTPSTGGTLMAGRPISEIASRTADSAPPSAGNRGPASADAVDMVRNAGDLQGLKIPPSGVPAISVVSESAPSPESSGRGPGDSGQGAPSASAVQETNVYINGQGPSRAVDRDADKVVINVPKPSAPGVPVTRPASGSSASGSGSARQGTPAAAVPAAVPAAAAKPASGSAASGSGSVRQGTPAAAVPASSGPARSPARSSPAPAARNSPPPRSPKDYWIQTGAFSALVRAEDVKETLASKGLSSIIDDREVEGQTWYRVRVGPYTSENEANYWLALVRAIDGFDESQVRSTQR